MQDSARRPPFAQSPSRQANPSFVEIDAVHGWRARCVVARPIAKWFPPSFLLLRVSGWWSRVHPRDEDAVAILSNAKWREMITRRQWKISAHDGDSYSTLPSTCHPGSQ